MQVEVAIDESDISKIKVGPARHLHRRRLSDPHLRGQGATDPQGGADGAERRHLHGRRRDRESQPAAGAGDDRQRAHRRRLARGRAQGARTRRCATARPASQRRKDVDVRAHRRGGRRQWRRRRRRCAGAAAEAGRRSSSSTPRSRRGSTRSSPSCARGWRSCATLPEADRRTRGERLRGDMRQKINAMLNPEQQKQYAEIVAAETGRGGGAQRARLRARRAARPREVRAAPRTDRRQRDRSRQRRSCPKGAEVIVGNDRRRRRGRAPGGERPRLPF